MEYHILNPMSHGSFNYSGKVIDVLVLDRAGRSLQDEEKYRRKTERLWQWSCERVSQIMTQLVKAAK